MTLDMQPWHLLGILSLNTMHVALKAALLVTVASVLLAYAFRLMKHSRFIKPITQLPYIGYSLPGSVIAIGVIAVILVVESQWLYAGTIALIYGYAVRFFAVGYGSVSTGMEKLPSAVDDAAYSMGSGVSRNLFRIHLPLLRPALFAAMIMVFIDITKELPMTLILRPFNFDTLATRAFQFAKDEMAPKSAACSLLIICTSALPVYFLNKLTRST